MIEITNIIKALPDYDNHMFYLSETDRAIASEYHLTDRGWFDKLGVFAGRTSAEVCDARNIPFDIIKPTKFYAVNDPAEYLNTRHIVRNVHGTYVVGWIDD